MRKNGFTLIELMIVVIIIGVLANLALPQYKQAIEKARATEAVLMFSHMRTAEFLYYYQWGVFANTSDASAFVDIGDYYGQPLSNRYTDRTNEILKIKLVEKLFKDYYVEAFPKSDTGVLKKYKGGFIAACRKAKEPYMNYVFGMDYDGNIMGQSSLRDYFPAEFSNALDKDYKKETGM